MCDIIYHIYDIWYIRLWYASLFNRLYLIWMSHGTHLDMYLYSIEICISIQSTSRTLHMTCIFTYELQMKSRHELYLWYVSLFNRQRDRDVDEANMISHSNEMTQMRHIQMICRMRRHRSLRWGEYDITVTLDEASVSSHSNVSCHTCKWVMAHIWTSHIMSFKCGTYRWSVEWGDTDPWDEANMISQWL